MSITVKKQQAENRLPDCRKTSCLFKNGVAGAKPPTGTRGGSPSKIAPFRGKGFGDRDNKSEVYFKNRLFLQADRRKTACLNNHRTSQFIMPKTDILAKSLSALSQAVSSELSLLLSSPPKSPCNASNIANFIS